MEREEHSYVKIGNIEFHVVSRYHGTRTLEDILKRLIREEIERGRFNRIDNVPGDL